MASLNKQLRKKIRGMALEHKFGPIADQVRDHMAEVALKAYKDIFSESERRRMKRLPDGYLPMQDRLSIYIGFPFTLNLEGTFSANTESTFGVGGRIWLHSFGNKVKERGRAQLFPYVKHGHLTLKRYGPSDPIFKHATNLRTFIIKQQGELEAAAADVWGVLSSVNTDKRLLEVWPESEPFLKKASLLTDKPPLPAVPVAALTTKLGLP